VVGGAGLYHPPARVTYWSRVQAGRRDWLQQFQLMNISVQAQKYANEHKIFYDGILFYFSVIAATSAHLQ